MNALRLVRRHTPHLLLAMWIVMSFAAKNLAPQFIFKTLRRKYLWSGHVSSAYLSDGYHAEASLRTLEDHISHRATGRPQVFGDIVGGLES